MNQVQFGMLEAVAMKESIGAEIVEKQILEACNAKQYMLARKLIGHKIYNSFKGMINSFAFFLKAGMAPGEGKESYSSPLGHYLINRILASHLKSQPPSETSWCHPCLKDQTSSSCIHYRPSLARLAIALRCYP